MNKRAKVTLTDIAKHANVSISTVSRVLNGSAGVAAGKRQAVVEAAVELGYGVNPFPTVLSDKKRVIGLVTQHISNPFYGNAMYGVFDGLRPSGSTYIVTDGGWSLQEEKSALTTLRDHPVDGIILFGGNDRDEAYVALAESIPLIVVGRRIEAIAERCIYADNEHGGFLATTHLLEMGHRRILHITGDPHQPDTVTRQRGYERALREFEIPVDPALIVEGAFSERSGVLAVEMLVSNRTQFSAIFAANDQTAAGARLALHRRGIRVPEDVSIVGYDNDPRSAYLVPPLTTVEQHSYKMGVESARMLLDLLGGNPIQSSVSTPNLIVRESVSRIWK